MLRALLKMSSALPMRAFLEDRCVFGDVFVVSSEVFLQTCTHSIDSYCFTRPILSNVGGYAQDNACMHLQLYIGKALQSSAVQELRLHAWERVTNVEMDVFGVFSPF